MLSIGTVNRALCYMFLNDEHIFILSYVSQQIEDIEPSTIVDVDDSVRQVIEDTHNLRYTIVSPCIPETLTIVQASGKGFWLAACEKRIGFQVKGVEKRTATRMSLKILHCIRSPDSRVCAVHPR
jgi:hypothetical protein